MSTSGYVPIAAPVRIIALEVDGRSVRVREGSTILEACKVASVETRCWTTVDDCGDSPRTPR